ncbi:MAG TPA: hypothetical protein VK969_03480, partial [Acidimicrobiia bacterium]|nr:hypothetical protein [Acidimicrobiia bacterium]
MRPTRLDESLFADLAERSGKGLISSFIPTHARGRQVAQDRIHLKNQLSDAEEVLTELGYKPQEREERLASVRGLLEDVEFWEHQDEGLAVFIGDNGEFEAVSISHSLEPSSVVMPVHMMRPLMGDLYDLVVPVLALTRDEVSIYVASEHSVSRLPDDLPSFGDVNWFVDRETQRQQHPDRAGTSRSRHGHEDSSGTDEDLARFLREVDSALRELDETVPMVVLGDDDLAARFARMSERETISPPNSGLSSPISPQEIEKRIEPVMGELVAGRRQEAFADARDRLGMGAGSTHLEEALQAVMSGRVGTVIIHTEAEPVWGRFDES